MIEFNKVMLEPLEDDDKRWYTRSDLHLTIGKLKITIPSGFVTDLASVPRAFWSFFPPFGKYTTAAIIHDFLYSTKNVYGINKTIADKIFYKIMILSGTPKWKAKVMYYGVVGFGKPAFRTPKDDGSVPYADQAVVDKSDEANLYYDNMRELLEGEIDI